MEAKNSSSVVRRIVHRFILEGESSSVSLRAVLVAMSLRHSHAIINYQTVRLIDSGMTGEMRRGRKFDGTSVEQLRRTLSFFSDTLMND